MKYIDYIEAYICEGVVIIYDREAVEKGGHRI